MECPSLGLVRSFDGDRGMSVILRGEKGELPEIMRGVSEWGLRCCALLFVGVCIVKLA